MNKEDQPITITLSETENGALSEAIDKIVAQEEEEEEKKTTTAAK